MQSKFLDNKKTWIVKKTKYSCNFCKFIYNLLMLPMDLQSFKWSLTAHFKWIPPVPPYNIVKRNEMLYDMIWAWP